MTAGGIVAGITRANPLTLAALAAGGWLAWVWLTKKPGDSLAAAVVKEAGAAGFEAAKAVAEPVRELLGDISAAAYSQQEKEFLASVRVLGGVVPTSPVEIGIALSYMPTLQLLDGLPIFSQWSGIKAYYAAAAIHDYRQAMGLEPKTPGPVLPTQKPEPAGTPGGTTDYGPWWAK